MENWGRGDLPIGEKLAAGETAVPTSNPIGVAQDTAELLAAIDSANVARLAEVLTFRPREEPYDGYVCAGCGCAWFLVTGRALLRSNDFTPTFALTRQGAITGYNGSVICRDCGREASFR